MMIVIMRHASATKRIPPSINAAAAEEHRRFQLDRHVRSGWEFHQTGGEVVFYEFMTDYPGYRMAVLIDSIPASGSIISIQEH